MIDKEVNSEFKKFSLIDLNDHFLFPFEKFNLFLEGL